ncbi:MAG TPA: hypothetical protein VJT75_17500 [Thermoleophilaceae bacterium]|nr:hypothetical protein [Thermoleophilaceae bacterium]
MSDERIEQGQPERSEWNAPRLERLELEETEFAKIPGFGENPTSLPPS